MQPDDRRSRFAFDPDSRPSTRAASQPPGQQYLAGSARNHSPSARGWPPVPRQQAMQSPDTASGLRSVSFSSSEQPNSSHLMSIRREQQRMFPSPFEDEEGDDEFDDSFNTPRDHDDSRSRSQSFANTTATRRPSFTTNSSAYGFTQGGAAWDRASSYAPGLGGSSAGSKLSAGGYRRDDQSNMSPFLRDIGQMHTDDSQLYHRDAWVGNAHNLVNTRDDGGGSGTTSRRHSVSVSHPRRGVAGFSIPGEQGSPTSRTPEPLQGNFMMRGSGGGGGLMFSDDELAGSLNMLNITLDNHEPRRIPRVSGPSQPSSLPTYAPQRPIGEAGSAGSGNGIRLNLAIPSSTGSGMIAPSSSFGSPHARSYTSRFSDRDRDQSVSPTSRDRPDLTSFGGNNGNGYSNGATAYGGGVGNGLAGRAGNGVQQQQPFQQQQFVDQRGFQPSAVSNYRPPGDLLPGQQQQQQFQQQHQRYPSDSYPLQQQQQLNNIGAGPQRAPPPLSFQGLPRPSYAHQPGMASPLSSNAPPFTRQNSQPMHSPSLASYAGNGNIINNGQQQQFYPNPPTSSAGSIQQRQRQGSIHSVHSAGGGPPSPTIHTNAQQSGALSSVGQAPSLAGLGRGLPLHAVPSSAPLYIVEFKAGRTDIFYCADETNGGPIRTGDLVIVEADRGKDLGRVINDGITGADVEAWLKGQQQQQQAQQQQGSGGDESASGGDDGPPPTPTKKELMPKRIYGRAMPQDTHLLASKTSDEAKALQLCQSKVRQKKLPMEVIDAEYQWDRRKLTFYFVAERRIDFRELVRELFRLYKTRIWMASLQGPTTE